MTGIGFDTIALAVMAFVGLRYALAFVRHDVGRSERLRSDRARRLTY